MFADCSCCIDIARIFAAREEGWGGVEGWGWGGRVGVGWTDRRSQGWKWEIRSAPI